MPDLAFKGLIFDMDGTLTVPTLDFKAMREEIGLAGGDLAAEVLALPGPQQRRAWAIIERHERAALDRLTLQDGCAEFLAECRRRAIRLGLLTRNAAPSVHELCRRFGLTFDAVVTRDFPFIKPHPEPVLHIVRQWGLAPGDVLMVGDYVHDITCGRAAGTKTCFFHNPGFPDWGRQADFTVSSMKEIARIAFGAAANAP
jgi:HAD superfamily hydrolase (TIGR01549 family)